MAGIIVSTGSAVSVAANTKSADQITGTYQYLNAAGFLGLIAKASATGMNATMSIGGVPIVNDLPIPFTGTAGTLDSLSNLMASAQVRGGRVELTFRNTTGGAITVDFQVAFTPSGK